MEKTLKPLEIWVEGLCLVTTLLSCEVCDEHFEKKSDLQGCVWSLHCCLVKYVMNILKRNLGEGLCLVNTLLSCEVCDEQFEKKSGLMNHMRLVH